MSGIIDGNKKTDSVRDEFFWLTQMNKASVVSNLEEGLLSEETAKKIAEGIDRVVQKVSEQDIDRPKRVILYEPLLIGEVGVEATVLHIGRSSQDMHATYYSAIMRENVIKVALTLSDAMDLLNGIAKRHRETVVPNYTNGVAAQPNSFAHYLQGILAGFKRDAQRIREFYERLNLCPMGTTVLNGTCWPLNRNRIALLLGFAAPVADAYDAAQIKPVDEAVEFAEILASVALHVGAFIQDISVQYAQPRPWIILQEGGENTYVSSAMPQKRNPGLMVGVRELSTDVLAQAQGEMLRAHNLMIGMIDPKRVPKNSKIAEDTVKMLKQFGKVLQALCISPERALEELNNDWTCSQEIADILMSRHGLPFRIGHHVASGIVSYARKNNIRPPEFDYEIVRSIYSDVIGREYPQGNHNCPMSEDEFRAALDPHSIIANRKTSGGPQKEELDEALARTELSINELRAWALSQNQKIDLALEALDHDFMQVKQIQG